VKIHALLWIMKLMLVGTIFVVLKVNLLKTGTLWLVLCVFINKSTNFRHCGGDISLLKNPEAGRSFIRNLIIRRCKCDHNADIMTSHITRNRQRQRGR
jgi:hypothetical protein